MFFFFLKKCIHEVSDHFNSQAKKLKLSEI